MSETLSDAWGVHEIGFLPSKGTCILNEIMNLTVGKSSKFNGEEISCRTGQQI